MYSCERKLTGRHGSLCIVSISSVIRYRIRLDVLSVRFGNRVYNANLRPSYLNSFLWLFSSIRISRIFLSASPSLSLCPSVCFAFSLSSSTDICLSISCARWQSLFIFYLSLSISLFHSRCSSLLSIQFSCLVPPSLSLPLPISIHSAAAAPLLFSLQSISIT